MAAHHQRRVRSGLYSPSGSLMGGRAAPGPERAAAERTGSCQRRHTHKCVCRNTRSPAILECNAGSNLGWGARRMAGFRDQTLVDLADPTHLTAVLTGTPGHTDQAQARLMGMLARSYELPSARIDHISGVSVTGLRLQEALHPVSRVQGSVSQAVPTQTRSDVHWCETGALAPIWIDLLADLQVSLVAEVDPGGIDTVLLQSLDTFTTLDDFRSQFQFLDLDAFMAEHDLHSVEDLRAAFHYLRGEIHLRIPPTFDPGDPANAYTVRLVAALQIADPPEPGPAAAVGPARRGRRPYPGPAARRAVRRGALPVRADGRAVRRRGPGRWSRYSYAAAVLRHGRDRLGPVSTPMTRHPGGLPCPSGTSGCSPSPISSPQRSGHTGTSR